ncbi:MAG: potassium transporter TrkH [Proteobacteria bacterium]|nr:potassium transporter TrkH [Pseudomonadota bacterium]MBU0968030.1 potassium transporter TrkH [Pseudomonadota bacterium]
MKKRFSFPVIWLPIIFFGLVVIAGAMALHQPQCSREGKQLPLIDALFTATSATCVTGLTVVDTGTSFNQLGQSVILVLIQLGGLGIMTFSALAFYLWRHKVSMTDRIIIGQGLLHDKSFHLGHFLVQIVLWTISIEIVGAFLLYVRSPISFHPFSALFHAVSAFCNAGFGLFADNLMAWRGDFVVNIVIMALIILGGIGFSVLVELGSRTGKQLRQQPVRPITWYCRVVIKTSLALIVIGGLCIYLAEYIGKVQMPLTDAALSSLFQSVTCRTAGFNTLDIGRMSNVSLLFMLILMFIGGAPGSCAGGIKVTTFRVLIAFAWAQIFRRKQAVVQGYGIEEETMNKAFTLMIFAVTIIFCATILLNMTEGGGASHQSIRGLFLDALFEATSAFSTVGLSTGLTPKLSIAGKCIVIILMFIGRLGPLIFLDAMHSFYRERFYTHPEEKMMIG